MATSTASKKKTAPKSKASAKKQASPPPSTGVASTAAVPAAPSAKAAAAVPSAPASDPAPSPAASPAAATTSATSAAAVGAEADYLHFLPLAQALEGEILPMRADLPLVLINVTRGVAVVLTQRDEIGKALPGVNITELEELPSLVHATIFANLAVDRSLPASQIPAILPRARTLRGLMLKFADGLADAGLLPRPKVDGIAAGSGPIDTAMDCIELSSLYLHYASNIAGKHPITDDQVREAGEIGKTLLGLLKPGRARLDASSPAPGADLRNRFWTLVVRRYDVLARVGAFLFGVEAVNAKVPPLLAARRKGRSIDPEPAAEEAEPTAAATALSTPKAAADTAAPKSTTAAAPAPAPAAVPPKV